MEIHGNPTTFNLERVLQQNIAACDYFRNDCLKLSTWNEVIDQIFYDVTSVEPWLGGNARGASSAFCLLYRLGQLQPTEEQVQDTITHVDSPFIRAIGFLYLRYVADPKVLWSWMSDYVKDKEEFQPSGPSGPTVTMGDFVIDLLLEQYYFETIFPRIPKKVQDDIVDALRSRGLPTTGKGNAGAGGPSRRGDDEGNRRPASVKASLSVAFGQRAPNRANTREDGVKRGETIRTDARGGDRERNGGSRHDEREHDRRDDRRYERGGGHRGDSRGGSHRDDRYDRHRVDDRRGGGGGGGGGGYSRYEGSGREGSGRYGRSKSRTPERERRHRSRSRSGERRGVSAGRDARDVFKESAAEVHRAGGAADELKSRYGDASVRPGEARRHRDDRGGGGSRQGGEEVYRLGGGSYSSRR